MKEYKSIKNICTILFIESLITDTVYLQVANSHNIAVSVRNFKSLDTRLEQTIIGKVTIIVVKTNFFISS